MSDSDRLAGIKARLASATPGPWRPQRFVGDPGEPGELGIMAGVDRIISGDGFVPNEANARLIGHAPADLAWLVGQVERLHQALGLASSKPTKVFESLNEIADNCLKHLQELEATRAENARLAEQLLHDALSAASTRELNEAVRQMREHQKLFFGGDRTRERVGAAKKAERRVDELLAGTKKPEQADLFGGGR